MVGWSRVALFAVTSATISLNAWAGTQRQFTLADDIELARFVGELGGARHAAVESFSPDGKYFTAITERGRLQEGDVQDTIWVFSAEQVRRFLTEAEGRKSQLDAMALVRASDRNEGAISELRWLEDSSGLVFLSRSPSGAGRVSLFDIRTRTLENLTPDDQDVTGFDFHARSLLYTARAIPVIRSPRVAGPPEIAGTGHDLMSLLFPEQARLYGDLCELWTISSGKRSRVENLSTHQPIYVHQSDDWQGAKIALSPDGRSAIARLMVPDVPKEWESYASEYSAYRIVSGRQDIQASFAPLGVESYYLINLATGLIKPLVDAPIGEGYTDPYAKVRWSRDGEAVLLPDAFLPLSVGDPQEKQERLRRPCVVVVKVSSNAASCVTALQTGEEARESSASSGPGVLEETHFESSNDRSVVVTYAYWHAANTTTVRYRQRSNGSWTSETAAASEGRSSMPIEVRVQQGLNQPPVLVARQGPTGRQRVFWDPNPQLRDIALGEANVLRWSDARGRQFVGGLVKPPDFVPGRRYPLVIQTHGFSEARFLTSGSFTSAFAARELAGSGILVLQAPDCAGMVTPDEASCNVGAYQAAVEKLASDGLVDTERVGIIGFSRTCYYVMTALTGSGLHFAAASINDGVNFGYFQYLIAADYPGGSFAKEAEAIIGSAPFGTGLHRWFEVSPEFNMDRVATPLRIEAVGPQGLLFMWEPYAALRYLHRPVDLIVLENGTHPLSNPMQRLISQGGNVHWFRFWLQGYEDPSESKAEQYRRWEKLCDMQVEQNPGRAAFCVRSKPH